MEFAIIGPTELVVEGRNIFLGTAKQRGFLAALLYHAGTTVRVDTIADYLWEGRALESCRPSLYALASRTRGALRDAGAHDALSRVPGGAGYRLNIDPHSVDYHRFRSMVNSARNTAAQGRHHAAASLLIPAIDLWRGEPMADLRGARADAVRETMNEAFLSAHRMLADCQLRLGLHDAVLARLEPLLQAHYLDEPLARCWISALDAAGRSDDARSFAIDFRRRFRRMTGVESSVAPLARRASVAGRRAPVARDDGTAGSEPPDQLPRDISDFTGRVELLTRLDDLTNDRGSIVILSGMPGAGKTTLATHWAHWRKHRFPDGQLCLNADGYGSTPPVRAGDALARFLLALGVPSDRIPSDADQREEYFNHIVSGRRMLIVLDNVLNSEQARPLIPRSSSCVTIITSRNRLTSLAVHEGVRGITVAPLSDEESVGLLKQVVGPERAAGEPAAVLALAQLSGGLPLALRIIGEHVAERSLASLADLVGDLTAHLLDCEVEDGEDATLRHVFTWSYNALDPLARQLFRLIAIHPGRTISVAAAGVLLGPGGELAERALNLLARANVVNHDTAGRYRCHDLIRRYAEDLLRRDEPAPTRRATMERLLTWYLLSAASAAALLAPQRGPVPELPDAPHVEPVAFGSDAEAMAWCEAERANLPAVVRMAASDGFHRHAWQIAGAVHEIYGRYGRQYDILDIHHIALTAATAEGHAIGRMGTHNNLGATYFAVHEYALAEQNFRAALDLARDVGDDHDVASCSHNLASVHLAAGQTVRAVRLYEEAVRIWRRLDDRPGEAHTLHRLGDAYRQMGRPETAEGLYRDALDIRQSIGSLRGQAATHGQLAALHLEAGRPHDALRHCAVALDIHAKVTDEANRCDVLTTAADAHRTIGHQAEALRDAYRAIGLADDLADSPRKARALAVLAAAFVALGELDNALEQCDRALRMIERIDGQDARVIRDRLLGTQRTAELRSVAG